MEKLQPFECGQLPSEQEADNAVCPHSHLRIRTLKLIGHTIAKVGKEVAESAIIAALQNVGAFKQ